MGVRTGASFVQHGETGVVVDRLPPGELSVKSDADATALAVFIDGLEKRMLDRRLVRQFAADQFSSDRIVDRVISSISTVLPIR